jgi:hypothetical protein
MKDIVSSSEQLPLFSAAKTALAQAVRVDEVIQIKTIAAQLAAAARVAKDGQLAADAAELRLRAERHLGEMMKKQAETIGLNKGGGEKGVGRRGMRVKDKPALKVKSSPSLKQAGIDKSLANKARVAAAIPKDRFERETVPDTRKRAERLAARERVVRPGPMDASRFALAVTEQISDIVEKVFASRNVDKVIELRNEIEEAAYDRLMKQIKIAISKLEKIRDELEERKVINLSARRVK